MDDVNGNGNVGCRLKAIHYKRFSALLEVIPKLRKFYKGKRVSSIQFRHFSVQGGGGLKFVILTVRNL